MAVVRALISLAHRSTLPADRIQNTLHYSNFTLSAPAPAEMLTLATGIAAAYTTIQAPGVAAPQTYMGRTISTVALAHTVTLYDLEDPLPRIPLLTHPFTLVPGAQPSLPAEVAACLSYSAPPTEGVPNARRRGRIFFGPLDNTVVLEDPLTFAGTVSLNLRNALCGMALRLGDAGPDGWSWVVWSPTRHAENPANPHYGASSVTNAYCDDAFDTIRSRGEVPKIRTSIAVPINP